MKPSLVVALVFSMTFASFAQTDPPLPPDEAYVQVRNGHLMLNGQRQRYWGWIGHFWLTDRLNQYKPKPTDTPEERAEKYKKMCEVYDALAQRIADTGFNLVRFWNGVDYTASWKPGDMSPSDEFGFMLAALEKRGIKVWATSFNSAGAISPDDVNIIDSPQDADAWKAAITEQAANAKNKRLGLRSLRQLGWDPRAQARLKQGITTVADWRNPYQNNIRLGDNPQVVVWELSNEEWFFASMTRGDWQKLPRFFRDSLQVKWTQFLRDNYKDDAGLKAAWGFLLEGESLDKGTVLIAPLATGSDAKAINDANPAAIALLSPAQQTLKRENFTRVRASDVVRFFSEMEVAYKTQMRDHAKLQGKSLKLSPMLMDTGDGFRASSVYLHQFGDASSMCSYIWQLSWDRQHKRFPFISGLDEPPRMAMGVPWLEVGKHPDRPFFVYEFQQNNPDKYRAEVPYRIAALGAAQDWDIINFHLFGRPNDPAEATPYSKVMNYSHAGDSIEGVHFKNDEVYTSALKGAGLMFRNSALKAPENPTVMTFGKRTLYAPETADYGKSFANQADRITATAQRFGLRMIIDPSKEKDEVSGRTVDPALQQANPMRPTDQIEYDWHRGHLKLDSPSAVGYTGFFAQHNGPVKFTDGTTLSDVKIINDPGMAYPMSEAEQYVSFALVAEDARPLAESKKLYLSLVSTSFNNGFKLNEDNVARGDLPHMKKPYEGQTMHSKNPDPPVLYARAGATITSPNLANARWRAIDWHMKELAAGTVGADGVLTIPADKPIFAIELTR